MAILIRNGLVLTFEPDALRGRIIPDGAVAVEGTTIAAIGDDARACRALPEGRDDRRVGQDRHARLHRHPHAHALRAGPQHACRFFPAEDVLGHAPEDGLGVAGGPHHGRGHLRRDPVCCREDAEERHHHRVRAGGRPPGDSRGAVREREGDRGGGHPGPGRLRGHRARRGRVHPREAGSGHGGQGLRGEPRPDEALSRGGRVADPGPAGRAHGLHELLCHAEEGAGDRGPEPLRHPDPRGRDPPRVPRGEIRQVRPAGPRGAGGARARCRGRALHRPHGRGPRRSSPATRSTWRTRP